jgi:hypothetical protein
MEIFSLEWRAYMVSLGEQNITQAKLLLDKYDKTLAEGAVGYINDVTALHLRAQVLIGVAQAYFAAANVRVSSPREWRNES